MLEEQDWDKIKERVATSKNIKSHEEKIQDEIDNIQHREGRKTEYFDQIRELRDKRRVLAGQIRQIQGFINAQDRAIVACQKRINERKFKVEKIRHDIIDSQEEAATKRRRSHFRRKVLKDKIAELWQQE